MRKTLTEIANIVDGEVLGDGNVVITGLCGIKEAKNGDLSFVANPKYFILIEKTLASALLVPRDFTAIAKPVIRVDDPSVAFVKIAALFLEDNLLEHFKGIHPTAIIAPDAQMGKNVSVGPFAVIESKAQIGNNTIIYSGCYVGRKATIGKDCLIYPNVSMRERIQIGDRVIVHSGAVIGSDGFGFVNVKGVHQKIPQIGTVVIEDDVEIGANVTIDRARFDRTIIGRGTKIDNLVHIAHNVTIGEHCIIVAQAGISGSVAIEKNAVLAGQAGIAGHLTIGEGAIVAAQAGVTKSVPAFTMVSGYPAKPHDTAKKVNACVQRLPEYIKTINDLEKKLKSLEDKIDKCALTAVSGKSVKAAAKKSGLRKYSKKK
ncbi:MAG TPA: UDP-3-O-(3-hydroxymyristoyl)glucosamine N-acyltransferase [Candidatus Omnitrophota bacterium]|nr:UDP-3-O-(3-hydroxymyristoyl)glucosamine N-acyltransferase [Candidatus Omnitrophota bacterium]HPD84302.1 UDP-3-O-(3-hydroxymyristoyl)glucosamine N-acyltransferase [Candidatus Omnitrophota bacterium]HRZ03159.1 UDP-3-O-(3-hydroxymyristoyl)glucosamine N-acyltransferase [Candidatus Omnitrophota bacterium]